MVSLRLGRYKYNRCSLDPEQLFDLERDPNELVNLIEEPYAASELAHFRKIAQKKWDLERFDKEVRRSQARCRVVYQSLRNGEYYPWDYQPIKRASELFIRNHMDLNNLEDKQRFPRGNKTPKNSARNRR